jgi:AraC-like DNA-binding protein
VAHPNLRLRVSTGLHDDGLATCGLRSRLFDVHLFHSSDATRVPRPAPSARYHYYELLYIERGEGDYYLESRVMHIGPGDILLTVPEKSFSLYPDPMRYIYWLLRFDEDVVATSAVSAFGRLRQFQAHHYRITESERTRWENRFRYLHDELRLSHNYDGDSIVRHLVRSILRDFIQAGGRCEKQNHLTRQGLIETIFCYIDAYYRTGLRLRDIAAAVNFSPAYLTDLVRRETGRPIHQWVNMRRIRTACALLAETDLPIGAIADRVGFGDPSYFSRYFSRITGKAPREWRKARKPDWLENHAGISSQQDGTLAPTHYEKLRTLAEACSELLTWHDVETRIERTIEEIYRPSLFQILRKHGATFTISRQAGTGPSVSSLTSINGSTGVLPLVVNGNAILANDLERSPIELLKRFSRLGYRSLISAPIMSRGNCLGVIRLLDSNRGFSENDRSIMATIGSIAGLALADKIIDRPVR